MPKQKNKQRLVLRKFDITSIPDDSVVVFVGKRETGKSFLVRDLLYHKQHLPIGTVISATEGANEFYQKMVPKKFIRHEYEEAISERVVARQKMAVKQSKRDKECDPRAFYLLDDCMFDSKWTRSKMIRALFMNGRHFRIMFLITMQYALGIPPVLRSNIDYIFLLRDSLIQNRRRLYDSYAGMFGTFDLFCRVMDQCTENFHCLVIHNNAKSNKLEDQVFWYKASPHGDFRVGHSDFWDEQAHQTSDVVDTDDDDDFRDDGLRIYRGDYDGRNPRRFHS
tara:strand:- start:394 stop:1233 length:840 start_codon:yes stop_codon:yes gene_type:complete